MPTPDKGHTPLLLASFKSNLSSVKLLLDFFADPRAENEDGLNVLHCAAQGDQALMLCFFKEEYGMNLSIPDARMSTPLHWALYQK